jgi:uncharacterized protein YqgV (UPF0045/DUF77 family)
MLRDQSRVSRSAVLLLALVGVSRVMALDIDDVHITKQGSVYQIQMTFSVDTSVNQVIALLTDYGFPNRLNPEVTKREVISRQKGITRVRTEIRSCVFFFCKDVALTQDVTVVANTIQADIVPDESDFRSGYLRWSVSSNDSGGSDIAFKAVIQPDFFIPPLIGGFFVRKSLRREILETAKNLETEAARESAPVMNRN